MNIRKLIKNLLFVFIVVSFAFLIYKEVSSRNESNTNQIAEKQSDTTSITGESASVPGNRNAEEAETKQKEAASLPQSATTSQSAKVIAYYFHGTFRCTTCRTIEKYSHNAIQQYFSKELGNGKLEFKPLNVEETENRHYIQDYQLFSRSLVLSLVKDGKEMKWKNLTDVWTYVRDKDKFFQYVKDEVEKFLKGT